MSAVAGLVARDAWYNSPPPPRTRMDNHPTLLVSWWCTGCALVLILTRLWGRCIRTEKLFVEDKIMALSIIPLFTRMALVDPVMLYGTNNVVTTGLSAVQIDHRMIGSKLVLASRIFYALFIWTAKWTVSEYLRRLTTTFWTRSHQRILRFIRIFLIITFFAVVIATLGECHPFDHYWQVEPDPGSSCRSGFAQLFVMSICDIVTDVLLIAFPISIIARSSMPLRRKLSISTLFGLSIILVVITAYRLSAIVQSGGRQQLRTLWASIEILAAAAVSNALILGSFVRDRGVKKVKYKGKAGGTLTSNSGSEGQPNIARHMTLRHWGNDSDENLFASLRGRLDSAVETEIGMMPAPKATDVVRPFGECYTDEEPRDRRFSMARESERASSSTHGPDLLDVGGILTSSPKDSISVEQQPKVSDDSHTPLAPVGPPGSSTVDFADVGGLLSGSKDGAAATSAAPRPPGFAYNSRAPVRAPLHKANSGLSAASEASQGARRSSIASSALTDDSTGESRAIALDMLAKIREARERSKSSAQQRERLTVSDPGRLFGEAKPG